MYNTRIKRAGSHRHRLIRTSNCATTCGSTKKREKEMVHNVLKHTVLDFELVKNTEN